MGALGIYKYPGIMVAYTHTDHAKNMKTNTLSNSYKCPLFDVLVTKIRMII